MGLLSAPDTAAAGLGVGTPRSGPSGGYGGGQGAGGCRGVGLLIARGREGPGDGVEVPSSGEKRARPRGDGPCFHLLLLVSSYNPEKFYPWEGRRRETAPASRSRSCGLLWGSAGRTRLSTQGTRVQAPVQEGPTCRGAARPARHDCGSLRPKTHAPQPETSPQ